MLLDAMILATLSVIGFAMVYKKLPRKLRKFLEKHALFTDTMALLLTYSLFGGTLTALIAGALVGIMTSMLLHIANNPDDFMFLYDTIEMMNEKINALKKYFNTYGKEYKAEKEARLAS